MNFKPLFGLYPLAIVVFSVLSSLSPIAICAVQDAPTIWELEKKVANYGGKITRLGDDPNMPVIGLELSVAPVWGKPISSRFIGELSRFSDVETLTIRGAASINDAVFFEVSKFKKLRRLSLISCDIKGHGLVNLDPNLPIEYLDLSSRIDEVNIPNLKRFKSLRHLVLGGGLSGVFSVPPAKSIRYELRNGKTLEKLLQERIQVCLGMGDDGVAAIADSCPNLESLTLGRAKVTDAGIRELAGLKNLKRLHLPYTAVSDAGVRSLKSLQKLEILDLSYNYVTAQCLKSIAQLSKLRRLNLSFTPVGDVGLEALNELKALESLDLRSSLVSARGFGMLAKHPTLSGFRLKGTRIQVPDLFAFSQRNSRVSFVDLVDSLELPSGSNEIDLRNIDVTHFDLAVLGQVRGLTRLNLSRSKLGPDSFAQISQLRNLKWIDFSYTSTADQDLPELSGLKNLESLVTHGTSVTYAGKRHLFHEVLKRGESFPIYRRDGNAERFWDIDALDLTCSNLADDDLKPIGQISNLAGLKIAGNAISDRGVVHLSNTTSLKYLWLGGEGISGASLEHLRNLDSLNLLWLTDTAITNNDIFKLLDFELEHLNLCGTQVDEKCMDVLVELKTLKTLVLDIRKFSKESERRLGEQIPGLIVTRSSKNLEREMESHAFPYEFPGYSVKRLGSRYSTHPLAKPMGDEYFLPLRRVDAVKVKNFEHLKYIDTDVNFFGVRELPSSAFTYLAGLNGPRKFSFYRVEFDDAALSELAGMQNLVSLDLQESSITNEGISRLKDLRGLKTLRLGGRGARLKPPFLDCLDEMQNLEELSLNNLHVTNDAIEKISNLKKLKSLRMRFARVGSAAKLLARLSNLERLDLSHTRVSDADLIEFLKLPNLKYLNVSSSRVSAEFVAELGDPRVKLGLGHLYFNQMTLKRIQQNQHLFKSVRPNKNGRISHIVLSGDADELELLPFIRGCSDLVSVHVTGDLTDRLAKEFGERQSLVKIAVQDGSLSLAQLKLIRKAPGFAKLHLWNAELNRNLLPEIGAIRQLSELVISSCTFAGTRLLDDDFEQLAKLESLTYLNLKDAMIGDVSMKSIARFSKLRYLYLDGTNVTDVGVYPINRWKDLQLLTAVGTKVTPTKKGPSRVRTEK